MSAVRKRRSDILALRGDHCACSVCNERFNSTAAFDKHRTGDWQARRCMTPEQMRSKGMAISATGWWVTSSWKRPIRPFRAIAGAAIDPAQVSP